jgi:hypothetical protein
MERNLQQHSERNNNRNRRRTFVFTSNQLLISILVVVVLFAILWIWKELQINSLKRKQAERLVSRKQQTTVMLANSDKQYLKLLAKPYVWAVRTEMMNGNMAQVNLYANDLVKEMNFRSIMIADNKGTIVSSTNKKLEGQNLSALGSQAYTTTNNTVVNQVSDSLLMMTSPIMGFNSRLGTLIINYSPQKPAFK